MHGTPADEMQMNVEDRLSGFSIGVEHRPIATRGDATLRGDRRRAPNEFTHELIVGGAWIVQWLDITPRHDEHMRRSLRVDIVERDDLVVLVNDRRLNLAVHDSAEQAVGHGRPFYSRRATAARAMP